jgi:hypothetical protein
LSAIKLPGYRPLHALRGQRNCFKIVTVGCANHDIRPSTHSHDDAAAPVQALPRTVEILDSPANPENLVAKSPYRMPQPKDGVRLGVNIDQIVVSGTLNPHDTFPENEARFIADVPIYTAFCSIIIIELLNAMHRFLL